MEADSKRGKTRRVLGNQTKKKLDWAGWPQRLELLRATPWLILPLSVLNSVQL